MIEPSQNQIKAARALLGWTQADLADSAGVGLATIKRFETGTKSIEAVSTAVRRALEEAGVEFLAPRGGKGVGVRLLGEEIDK